MATPEPAARSRRFRSAAAAERTRLLRELERLEHQAEGLRARVALFDARAAEVRQELSLLAHFTHEGDDGELAQPNLRVVDESPQLAHLRGAAIRRTAVRVLAASPEPSRPIRYSDWYELLVAAGYEVAGQDPLAAFLTQIGRSPLVRRAERGLYALDLDVPRRLQARLHSLHQELAGLHNGQQTIKEVASVAERRRELTTEALRAQRELEEALSALAATHPETD